MCEEKSETEPTTTDKLWIYCRLIIPSRRDDLVKENCQSQSFWIDRFWNKNKFSMLHSSCRLAHTNWERKWEQDKCFHTLSSSRPSILFTIHYKMTIAISIIAKLNFRHTRCVHDVDVWCSDRVRQCLVVPLTSHRRCNWTVHVEHLHWHGLDTISLIDEIDTQMNCVFASFLVRHNKWMEMSYLHSSCHCRWCYCYLSRFCHGDETQISRVLYSVFFYFGHSFSFVQIWIQFILSTGWLLSVIILSEFTRRRLSAGAAENKCLPPKFVKFRCGSYAKRRRISI